MRLLRLSIVSSMWQPSPITAFYLFSGGQEEEEEEVYTTLVRSSS